MFGGEREEDHRELKLGWSNSEVTKWIRKTTIPGSFSRYEGEPVFNGCLLKLSQRSTGQTKSSKIILYVILESAFSLRCVLIPALHTSRVSAVYED